MKTNTDLRRASHRYFTNCLAPAVSALLLILAPNADAQNYALLHQFGLYADGYFPTGGLIQGSDGVLYGTTGAAGNSGIGTVFRLNSDGTGFATLLGWGSADGLVLFGTTLFGGDKRREVFKVNTDGSGYMSLQPLPEMVEGPLLLSGTTLYGTTIPSYPYGGVGGTIFKLSIDGNGYTNLKTLRSSDGAIVPHGGLILINSTLYGVTRYSIFTTNNSPPQGCGTVFKMNVDGTGFTVLKVLCNRPAGRPVASGNTLYGVTENGGPVDYPYNDSGLVFRLNTDGSGYTVLTNLTRQAHHPNTGLTMWGRTLFGVADGMDTHGDANGVIFALTTQGTDLIILRTLNVRPPMGPLLVSSGSLYGTACFGGSSSNGAVFKLSLQPMVLNGPTNQTVAALSTVSFAANILAAPPVAYQWFYNGTNALPLGTNRVLTLTDVQPSEAGVYHVVASSFGTVTSPPARLDVGTLSIITQPTSHSVGIGGRTAFSVGLLGAAPISYQWRFNGTPLAGATDSVLNLTNVQPAQAGDYTVVVTNVYAALTSSVATLTVTANPIVSICTEAALRDAINQQATGAVRFACDGTITLTNTLTNEFNTVIDTTGHNISLGMADPGCCWYRPVLCITTNTSLTLIGLTIDNGYLGGGQHLLSCGWYSQCRRYAEPRRGYRAQHRFGYVRSRARRRGGQHGWLAQRHKLSFFPQLSLERDLCFHGGRPGWGSRQYPRPLHGGELHFRR